MSKTKRSKRRPRTIAQARSRSRRRTRARRNPAAATAAKELATQVGIGFAGYAATRFLGRAIATIVAKKSPKMAKHAGFLGTIATFGTAFFVLPNWKRTEDYAPEALLGSGIAVLQNGARTYLPKYGWLVGDYQEDLTTSPQLPEPRGDAEIIDEDMQVPAATAGLRGGQYALPGTGGGTRSDDDLADLMEADLGSLGYGGDSADLMLSELGME